MHDLDPGNCLWIHPTCAKALGIKHRQPVLVENAHGDVTGPLPVKVTESILEKTVYRIHGFGHSSKGLTKACCMGGSDAVLIKDYAKDAISDCTGMRTEFVEVRLAEGNEETYPCALGGLSSTSASGA